MENLSFLVAPSFLRAGGSSSWVVSFLNMAPRHLRVDELIQNTAFTENNLQIHFFFYLQYFGKRRGAVG
jgi:DNA polymerase sigma